MSLKRTPRQHVEFRSRRCPVHHALAIDEILRMITSHMRALWGKNSSLIALAMTCKTWSTVALDELWKGITTSELARISSMRSECIASNRPDIYAESLRKVQVLINICPQQEISTLCSILPTFRPHTIICQNSSQPIQTSILAPHITSLIFSHHSGIWDEAWLEKFSRDLQNVAPSLEILEITLVPRPVSMKALSHLAALHALRKLKLQLTDDCAYSPIEAIDGSSWVISDGKGLDALESLDIEAPIPVVQTILALTGRKLRNLRITGAPFDSAATVSGLFAQIGEGPWATGMTHLRYGVSNSWTIVGDWGDNLEEWGITDLERESVAITSKHLQPLLRLNSLSHLALTFHTRPRLDDIFYVSLAHKLPLLQNLTITGRDRTDDTYPPATLGSVLILAQLPLLSALHIPLDIRVDACNHLAVEQHFNSLTRLCVSDSPAPTEYCEIIPTIAALFPKLRKVYVPNPGSEDPRYEGWLSLWDEWKSGQTARFLEIVEIYSFEPLLDELDQDFFVAAVADSIGFNEAESDSVDYLNSSVDLDEYYTRFPEARRHPVFEIDDIMYATPQDIST